jgi:hypothetical protein
MTARVPTFASLVVLAAMTGSLKFALTAGEPTTEGGTKLPPEGHVIQEEFDDADLLKRGWYDGDQFRISTREPKAGKGCLEYHWPAGATVPDTSTAVRHLFEHTETVYLRFHLKLSKGWRWTGRSYHPHLINLLTTENSKYHGPAASHLTLYIEPWNGHLRLAAQDIQNKDTPHGLTQGPLKGGYNGTMFDSREVVFGDEKWHEVEAVFTLNSLDLQRSTANADGVAKGWVDGKLVVDRSDVVFRSVDFPTMKLNQLLIGPYFGPGLLPHEQTLWIDEMVIADDRRKPFVEQ